MKITQLYTLVNSVTKEILGDTAVVNEDLSNVVDIGKSIFDQTSVDNYVKKLVNHIGKVVFQNRAYAGGVPSVLMDAWEFGSVLQKVSMALPEATENESWNLVDGQEYKQDVFTAPKVEAKFYNSKVTFEIPMSFTELQVKESFSSAEQLNGFVSMITTGVENTMTVKLDALIMRAINNMTGETLVAGRSFKSNQKIGTGNFSTHGFVPEWHNVLTIPRLSADPTLTFMAKATPNDEKSAGLVGRISVAPSAGPASRIQTLSCAFGG